MKSRKIVFLLILGTVVAALGAQQMSEKKDLSIFKLNYYGAPAYQPANVTISATIGDATVSVQVRGSGKPGVDALFQQTIGAVDQTIQKVFVDLGRFNIISMPQRLSTDDVGTFIQAIKDFKSQNLKIPDAVALGQQAFTEADFNKLTGSFVIVIPSVSFYDVSLDGNSYHATITANFSVINAADNTQIANIIINADGRDSDSQTSAMRNAVNDIPLKLTYEIRNIPLFQIATGITEMLHGDAVLEFGSNMGIQLGDEYNITHTENLGGYTEEKKTGLLIVKDVRQNVSIAQVIYANPGAQVGDQLREAPRLGVDVSPFADFFVDLSGQSASAAVIGLKGTLSRGVFAFRPFVDIGVYLGLGSAAAYYGYVPASIDFGGEYNLFLGRLKITPEASVGALGLVSLDGSDFQLGGIKAQGGLKLSILVADTVEIFAQGQYGFVFGTYLSSFSGPIIGAGVTIK